MKLLNRLKEIEELEFAVVELQVALQADDSKFPNRGSISWIFALLKRSVELAQVANASLAASHVVAAAILIRAIVENAAIFHGFSFHLDEFDHENEGTTIDQAAKEFLYGSRGDQSPFKATNILTHLKRYAKLSNPDILVTYDHLSNRSHPNFEGTFGAYIDVGLGQSAPKDKPSSLEAAAIESCLSAAVAGVRVQGLIAFGKLIPPENGVQ